LLALLGKAERSLGVVNPAVDRRLLEMQPAA
jgi:hypothetical protein